MATVTFSRAFNMADTSTQVGFATNTPTLIRIENASTSAAATLRQDYVGTFQFGPNGNLSGGTLNSLTEFDRPDTASGFTQTMSTTGLNVDALRAFQHLTSADINAFYGFIFAGSDTFTGSTGADTVKAYGGNDVIDAGGGNDNVDGGAGVDTVLYGARAGYSITHSFGATVVTETASGAADTLRNIELLRFSDQLFVDYAVRNQFDFTGDGRADVVTHNLQNGTVEVRGMNGTAFTGATTLSIAPSSDWRLEGNGDFNGDGQRDLLWRNDDGTVGIWQMNGTTFTGGGVVMMASNDWRITGQGDFNADGRTDILWRNDNGAIGIWQMNGTALNGGGQVTVVSSDWRITGSGDFDGDSKTDILWQNDNGTVGIWLMDGLTLKPGSGSFAPADPAWRIAGTGDFNGDARSDILWRHDNGDVGVWLMNGVTMAGGGVTENVTPSTNIAAVGDFNADGRADILFQDSTGTGTLPLSAHLMDGLTVAGVGSSGALASSDWIVV